MIDNRGTELKVGQEVAYNFSGEIAKGIIVDLKVKKTGSSWGNPNRADIRVELIHSLGRYRKGHISKVSNERNVLVLQTPNPKNPKALAHDV